MLEIEWLSMVVGIENVSNSESCLRDLGLDGLISRFYLNMINMYRGV